MKILSLFDGIACGLEALKRAWVKVDMYFASEIDRYAIQIATKNHPEIIEVGDVKNLRGGDYLGIDLLIWGSPCQDLSIAKANREGLAWKRSWLLFNYVEILKTAKPKRFLLENVASMSKESKDTISSLLWVEPILINSALVSGQQRKRLYRTNIPGITQPEDKGIILKDILEEDVILADNEKVNEPVRLGQYGKGGQGQRIYGVNGKSVALSANGGGQWAKTWLYLLQKEPNNLIDIVEWEVRVKQATKKGYIVANDGDGVSLSYPSSTTRRGRVVRGKSNTLTCGGDSYVCTKADIEKGGYIIRKLTPIECERLQTLPDNYTEGVSDTQRYKMLGNGRTVDVIAHIFSYLPKQ